MKKLSMVIGILALALVSSAAMADYSVSKIDDEITCSSTGLNGFVVLRKDRKEFTEFSNGHNPVSHKVTSIKDDQKSTIVYIASDARMILSDIPDKDGGPDYLSTKEYRRIFFNGCHVDTAGGK